MTIDWSAGSYEPTAEQLLPAATTVVRAGGVGRGQRVADIGCGTGNAALAAAALGAEVTGVDPAPRLLEVARERARALGVEVTFAVGEAAAIPLDDGAADVVLSVFATIFAADPPAAVAELVRVCAPGGRIVFSAWIPGGATVTAGRNAAEAIRRELGGPPPSDEPEFGWHDAAALREVFGPHRFGIDVRAESLTMSAPSTDRFVDDVMFQHPGAVTGMEAFASRADAADLRRRLRDGVRADLEKANEDPSGFRLTSRYVVVTARPLG